MTRVVVVTSGFPRLSETFALNELLALRERGMLAAVFATKPGTTARVQPQVESLRGLVRVLPPGDAEQQAATLVDWLAAAPRTSGDDDGAGGDGARDAGPVTAVHGYFAHQPAAVAAAAARRLGVPHGFSAHALDIRKVAPAEMAQRAASARAVITCNSESARQLRAAGADPLLVPHGVDVERFSPAPTAGSLPTGAPALVLAVGRLVEKKGLEVLVEAFARLGPDRARLRIVGTGPQEDRLRGLVAELGLGDVVELAGARTHEDLPGEYRQADVVVVPSVVDTGGDQDGLPNVVLEAMACGVAVVASDVAAVGDAVEHGRTGVLVPPGRPDALAEALGAVLDDDVLRRRLGAAARAEVVRRYDLATCTRNLCAHLEAMYA